MIPNIIYYVILTVYVALIAFGVVILINNTKVRSALGLSKGEKAYDESESLSKFKEELDILNNRLSTVENRCDGLEVKLESLTNEVKKLASTMENLNLNNSQSSIHNNNVVKEHDESVNIIPNSKKESVISVTKYAQQTMANGFDTESLLDSQTKFTKFIIHIKGNKATYEVPESKECQSKMLNGYASIAPFVEEVSRIQSPTAILNVVPGTLILKGTTWEIDSKLKIKLV